MSLKVKTIFDIKLSACDEILLVSNIHLVQLTGVDRKNFSTTSDPNVYNNRQSL